MKTFTRLTILSLVFYLLIQYSISTKIDANNDPYVKNTVDIQATPEIVQPTGNGSKSVNTEPLTTSPIENRDVPSTSVKPTDSIKPAGSAASVESIEPVDPTMPTGTTGSNMQQTVDELSPFSGLPYFLAENDERYIDHKSIKPELPYETIVAYVNIGIDRLFYTNVNVIEDPNSIAVLVNKYNKLPDDYVPELSMIDPAYCDLTRGRQYLRPEAKAPFEKMCNDAKALGLNISAYGSYRSIPAQKYIWNREIKEGKTVEEVDNFHARGGYSEHNTGLAVDVVGIVYSVENTKEFRWYKENAHRYGFIIRYARDKEFITGYKYEPWHLRYVGVEAATAVYESGLSYEEYCMMHKPEVQ